MSIEDVLTELRKTYLEALPEKAQFIEQLLKDGNFDSIETEFHKLKGTGKTYGLPEISLIGKLAEELMASDELIGIKNETIVKAVRLLNRAAEKRSLGQEIDLDTDSDYQSLKNISDARTPRADKK